MNKFFHKGISLVLAIIMMFGIIHIPNNVHAAGTDKINRYSVLVLDVSPSMSTASMLQMKEASRRFSSQVIAANGNNYVAIIAYSKKAQLICDFSDDLSTLNNAIDRVDSIYRDGTNTYAGLLEAQRILSSEELPSGAIKNIVLMTDGMPNQQSYTNSGPYTINECDYYESYAYSYQYANTVYNLAQEVKQTATIYSLGFYQDFTSFYPADIRSFAVKCLSDIASSPNHYYEVIRAEDLEFAFGDIADDIINDACPIIVIPGIAGSELIDVDENDKKIWLDLRNFKESTIKRMGLDATGISINNITALNTGFGTNNTYKSLINGLKKEYGDDNVYFFAYDWRMDNAYNALQLKAFIDNIGSSQVDIIAHSMGGLVASRFIADGNGNKIRKLVTLGTPYLGSSKVPYVFATGRLIEFLDIANSDFAGFGVAKNGIKKVVPHMTSAYQLLPYNNADPYIGIFHKAEKVGWFKETIYWNNVYDAHGYIKNNMAMTGINEEKISVNEKDSFLSKSTSFMESIHPGNVSSIESVDYHAIVGTGKQTIYTTIFDSNGGFMYDFSFKNGDGTVPLWSANINNSIPSDRLYTFEYSHTDLVKKQSVINQVIEILGSKTPANNSEPVKDNPYVVVRIACPVDVTITHNGETLSSVAEQFNYEAEFGSLYMIGENEDVKVLALSADNVYDLILQGTDTGTMDYLVRYYDSSDNLIEARSFEGVPVSSSTQITTNTDKNRKTSLLVDTNGDGISDNTLFPDDDISYVLTVNAGIGGMISEGMSGNYTGGEMIELTAVADDGYIFKNWSSTNGGIFANSNSADTAFKMPTDNTTVIANFERIQESTVINAMTTAKDFISIVETAKKSHIWILTFNVTLTYSNGNKEVVSYSINLNGNNANLGGKYKFGNDHDLAGYNLVYDIKGNGSNIKDFKLIPN